MEWIKYQIHTTTAATEGIGTILNELGIDGFEISDHVPLSAKEEAKMFTDIPAELPPDDGKAILTFYMENSQEEKTFYSTGSSLRDAELQKEKKKLQILTPEDMIALLQKKIKEKSSYFPLSVEKITYTVEDDSLWKDKWKENFKAFRIAKDILIKPSWEETPTDCKADDIIIQINPGSAFGTGTHETTKLCLLSLRKYISSETRLLDAGCGSGILAISALLCGAHSAFCLDIDPAAVSGTLENASLNNLPEERLHAIHANILEDGASIKQKAGGKFDIAVANILADVIVSLSEHIGEYLKPNGLFISSGILAEKAGVVEETILQNHFNILEKNQMGDWISFVARKQM